MKKIKAEVFPKVFVADKQQTVYVQITGGDVEKSPKLFMKIQPMERYGIPHTKLYRIDEEDRYSFVEMQAKDGGRYALNYNFFAQQQYDVQIKCDEKIICHTHIYSVKEDAIGLLPLKGDTHLHSCRSDGAGTPFEVGCAYRAAGYDFIALTDHHRYAPSLEGKAAFEQLTDKFTVFKGEEVHNRDMGYVHIINFGGEFSVNDIVENQGEFVEKEVTHILQTTSFDESVADRYDCAYRMFIAQQIRRGGGVAIMAHPYWSCYGEYNMQESNVVYLLKNGCFDALEVLAGCDGTNHGNNLQVALWSDLRAQGVKIPVVGASDAHSTTAEDSLFNKQYSLVFAKGCAGIKDAIKSEKSVAVLAKSETDYFVFGQFRWVKYARFLLAEYFPTYVKLAKKHAHALSKTNKNAIKKAETAIQEYNDKFFGW